MTHVTLTLNVTLTKQLHLYLVLNLCSLSTMISMNLFMATLCSMDHYAKPPHLYKTVTDITTYYTAVIHRTMHLNPLAVGLTQIPLACLSVSTVNTYLIKTLSKTHPIIVV